MRHLRIFMLMSSSPSSVPHCLSFTCLCTKSVISIAKSLSSLAILEELDNEVEKKQKESF